MDKILILQLFSILQSIAICFLCFCVFKLHKIISRFIEDEFSVSKKLEHYLTDPLDVVNAHPEPFDFDKFGLKTIEK